MEKEFVHLIKEYSPLLYKICNLYCDEAEDKKDLFQEIILQLWKAYPSFRNESAVSTWIYRIGLNTAVSNFRKASKRFFKTSISDAVFEVPNPSEFTDKNDQIVALHKAISHLNTVEKALIMLYLEQKSYDEIGEILGITRSNVGVKLMRIKEKLEKTLKSYSYES